MKRRSFLKDAAWATVLATAAPALSACSQVGASKKNHDRIAAQLPFRADGTFTLLQFTDTHYIAGDPRSERALACVKDAIEGVKPDLIIHTGDIVFGRPDLDSAREILTPLAESGIPWAVALGNHDSQFGSTREEIFSLIRSLPGCVNTEPKEGVYGCSNDVITLKGAKGVERAFYLFDSMDAVILKGMEEEHCYDYIRVSQLDWYNAHSQKLQEQNGGQPVPALAFFHIPLREIERALLEAPNRYLVGNNCEEPCPSRVNSGLFGLFLERGDVRAVVTGHDHDCDYVLRGETGIYFIYGRFSGCDTVYNRLGRTGKSTQEHPQERVSGCRVFQFRSGQPGCRTWVRLMGGEEQNAVDIMA
ncbi:MAG: metallophosphoesterase family protein [Bacteroidales bacterium]|nr:metallophosphoesterase family protein [Bacteroidales bacterium]